MKKLVVASNNEGKIVEIKRILEALPFEIVSLKDIGLNINVIEDGDTFFENAQKKAVEVCNITNEITLADDSGLCVDALDGKPGIYSARFAGEDATDNQNNIKLLDVLDGITDRTAKFLCSMYVSFPNGGMVCSNGVCNGRIITEAKGIGGFGYDPLFIPDGYDNTFAEIPDSIKNKISHRAKALEGIRTELKRFYRN